MAGALAAPPDRHRGAVKDLKLGWGLTHFPLRRRRANYARQTAPVIASNLTAMLSAANVARERHEDGAIADAELPAEHLAKAGRVHNTAVLRRWLFTVPARLVRSGRRLCLRLAQGMFHKREFWALHHYLLRLAPPG
jgi:hypothetical protein